MDKERTTQEGQVTYLAGSARRPGYLPALAHPSRMRVAFLSLSFISSPWARYLWRGWYAAASAAVPTARPTALLGRGASAP